MLTVQVQAFSATVRIAPADVQALAGALVPVAARLGVARPPLEGALSDTGLAYIVDAGSQDDDAAFREQCRQLGLVFALSRVRPDWSWSVRASPSLLADAAGAPEVLWVRDGAVVLRHADTPRGERVVASPLLSAAVIAELVHGLGADALRWLGVPTEGAGPSRRAALESSRGLASPDSEPLLLDGPVAGAGDLAPLDVQSLSVAVAPPAGGPVRDWTAAARVRLAGGEPVDAVDVVVRLRSGDGRLLAVAESSLDAVAAGETVRIEVEGSGEGPLETAVAADAWFALRRSHRLSGTVAVTTEEG